jgi:hypothetical protein
MSVQSTIFTFIEENNQKCYSIRPHSAIRVLEVRGKDQHTDLPTAGLRATSWTRQVERKALRPSCFQLFLDKPVTGTRVHCPQSSCSWGQDNTYNTYYEHWKFRVPQDHFLEGLPQYAHPHMTQPGAVSNSETSALPHLNVARTVSHRPSIII